MRIIRHVVILTSVLFCAFQVLTAGQPKYGVRIGTVKPAALTKARTYTWTVGRPSFNKKIDAAIVAAVDRELLARGLTKAAEGTGDVTVAYSSLSRTDVDTKNAPKEGAAREFDVGTLVVNMANPANRESLFQVRVDTPFTRDAAVLEGEINTAVAAIFAKYPAPPKR
jgi:hypothetical protein